MIDIDKIHKSFNPRDVLNGVSLRVEKGDIIAIIGGSGVGKSVLLKHITGLIRPDSGTISVDGMDVTNLRGKSPAEIQRTVGIFIPGGCTL